MKNARSDLKKCKKNVKKSKSVKKWKNEKTLNYLWKNIKLLMKNEMKKWKKMKKWKNEKM
jgi:hypothetical protein